MLPMTTTQVGKGSRCQSHSEWDGKEEVGNESRGLSLPSEVDKERDKR